VHSLKVLQLSSDVNCHFIPWAQLGRGHGGRVPPTFSDSGNVICHVPSHFSL